MFIEIIFVVFLVGILILNFKVYSASKKLTQEENGMKLSGFEIVRKYSENEPHIIKKSSFMLDHYNKDRNTIKLSKEVFDGESVYASIVAFSLAYQTKKENNKWAKGFQTVDFIVLASYIIIILGALLNRGLIVHFGMILFILAVPLCFFFVLKYIPKENEEKLIDKIKKAKIIKNCEEYENLELLGFIIIIATLPYRFIIWFK